jgi:hypothetical protein
MLLMAALRVFLLLMLPLQQELLLGAGYVLLSVAEVTWHQQQQQQ